MLVRGLAFGLVCVLAVIRAAAEPALLDAMDDPKGWKIVTSEGVKLSVTREDGVHGGCLRLDYEFTTGAGYGIIERPLALELPPNFEFAFDVRGESPANNLEFKIIRDEATAAGRNAPAAENVWWVNRKGFEFPANWTRVSYKRRHFTFGWGPDTTAIAKTTRVQFAIASFKGGKGSVWLDQLTFRPMEAPATEPFALHADAGSEVDEFHKGEFAVDGRDDVAWRSKDGLDTISLNIDLGGLKEFGGLVIDWEKDFRPQVWAIRLSEDGQSWADVRFSDVMPAERSWIALPDSQARFVRLMFDTSADKRAIGIREVRVRDVNFATTPNAYYAAIAKESWVGLYPKYFLGKQAYWTVVGDEAGGEQEALIDEFGAIEVDKQGFRIEPFLLIDGKLVTWADAKFSQELNSKGTTVRMVADGSILTIRAKASTSGDASIADVEYLFAPASSAKECVLVLALRPFQVNPPWQNLNYEGGWSPIRSIDVSGRYIQCDGRKLMLSEAPTMLAMYTGMEGDAVGEFAAGHIPFRRHIEDASGAASCILAFDPKKTSGGTIRLALGETFAKPRDPLEDSPQLAPPVPTIGVPSAQIADTFLAQQRYILINRDGPAIHPGSRTYERSWIRDGCLTSAALLATGHAAEARAFIDWYGKYQFESGKIPCVVDSRGPDPVPENDSHGQYIFALMNYYRYTKDRLLLEMNYDRVKKAVGYIESLIAQRSTPEFADASATRQEPGKPPVPVRAFSGLVPESISHEGYSAKPMHSYWDDFFTLRGLKDAVAIAMVLGEDADAKRFAALRDAFQKSLHDSIAITQQAHKIDYLPGCVELGDFDSTSTTIALWPCAAENVLPREWLARTFDKYWEFFQTRKATDKWEAFTPYELRHVGALVRLGQRERAVEALEWYMKYQRPAGWCHWAEVVWHDPETPKFIGDMPHTWCGSDFLNSLRTMLVYEHEAKAPPEKLSERGYDDEDALVLFAGVPKSWADDGVEFKNFPTHFGVLSASLKTAGESARVELSGSVSVPRDGLVLDLPFKARAKSIKVNGREVSPNDAGQVVVWSVPASVEVHY